jgi:hypothetical protein
MSDVGRGRLGSSVRRTSNEQVNQRITSRVEAKRWVIAPTTFRKQRDDERKGDSMGTECVAATPRKQ